MKPEIRIEHVGDMQIELAWDAVEDAQSYHVYWSDRKT